MMKDLREEYPLQIIIYNIMTMKQELVLLVQVVEVLVLKKGNVLV